MVFFERQAGNSDILCLGTDTCFKNVLQRLKNLRKFILALALGAFGLTACVSVDDDLISKTPASAQQFAEAKKAAATCGVHAPNWKALEAAYLSMGYSETQDKKRISVQKSQGVVILEKAGTDMVIMVGSRGGEGMCIVGLKNMTPQQSYELAQPWVKKFGLLTNAERGQGLSDLMVQVWGKTEERRVIYVGARKTFDVLDAPGSAASLRYIVR